MSLPNPWSEEFYREVETDELQHYGVPGMKWGVRKLDEKSGSYKKVSKKEFNRDRENYRNLYANKVVTGKVAYKQLKKQYGGSKQLRTAYKKVAQRNSKEVMSARTKLNKKYTSLINPSGGGVATTAAFKRKQLGNVVGALRAENKDFKRRVKKEDVKALKQEIENIYFKKTN